MSQNLSGSPARSLFRQEAVDFQRDQQLSEVTFMRGPTFAVYTGLICAVIGVAAFFLAVVVIPEQLVVPGYLVRKGMQQGTLTASLLVPPQVAQGLRAGQKVALTFDGFPPESQYSGEIARIARDFLLPNEAPSYLLVVLPVVPVDVELTQTFIAFADKKWELRPGMTLRGEITLAERSLWDWIFGDSGFGP